MTVKFFELFFNAIRIARDIEHGRVAADSHGRQTMIRDLCGEQGVARARVKVLVGDVAGPSGRLAA